MTPRRVAVLGSTGSIGTQALDVIESDRDRLVATAIVAGSDRSALEAQAARTGAAFSGLGAEAALEAASRPDVDVVLNAIVGAAGLPASAAALSAGKTLALANKESLVAGGDVCLAAAVDGGGRIVPVDSEHAAIAQCLAGVDISQVARIILTASGGPFRVGGDLSAVTPEDALAHPTWSMGPKITIDSATLMNKGLEVIEAHFLFGFGFDQIDVLVHPQSLVHGIVELVDGSILMQAAPTDMGLPIRSALLGGTYAGADRPRLDLTATNLEFEAVDHARFPALGIAYEAGRRGQGASAALNAANEVAVAAFLEGRLRFTDITVVVESALERHEPIDATSIEEVVVADGAARARAEEAIGALQGVGSR